MLSSFRLRLDSGRSVTFNLRENPHLDYGYAVTSHSSQGQTADRVLVNVDTEQAGEKLVNRGLAYVAVSHGRYDAQIYTNDKAQLADKDALRSRRHVQSEALPGSSSEPFGIEAKHPDEFLIDLYHLNGEMVVHELHEQGAALRTPRTIHEILVSLETCKCTQFAQLVRQRLGL